MTTPIQNSKEPTRDRLMMVLDYNPSTGLFSWIKGTRYKGRSSGRIAGSLKGNGYIAICVDRSYQYAHRLAWIYVYGEIPEGQIDHINRVRHDNRIDNLRIVTRRQNCWNSTIPNNCKSGHRGIYFRNDTNKWAVQISNNGKRICVGSFSSLHEAIDARNGAYCNDRRLFMNHGINKEQGED